MFILLDKSRLILDQDDISESNDGNKKKCFVVYDLENKDSLNPNGKHIEWSIPDDKQSAVTGKTSSVPVCRFTCGAFSPSGNLFALSDDQKNLIVYNENFIQTKHHFKLKKNAIKMFFNKNEDCILVCDKSGDIYQFDLKTNSEQLLLGHCSMLLDFVLTPDERFIISADRDEKIRVTHYPNTYSIATYCLGHSEFVSTIKLINNSQHLLASGSGDGKIKIWNYLNGKNIFTYDCHNLKHLNDKKPEEEEGKNRSDKSAIKCITIDQDNAKHMLVSFFTKPIVLLFKINYTTTTNDNQENFSSIMLINQLCLNNVPILISFDLFQINFVWIFCSKTEDDNDNDEAIKLYELKHNELIRSSFKNNLISILNQNEHFMKSLSNYKDHLILENLFKHSYYDNVEHLNNEQRKRSRHEETSQNL